MKAGGAAHCEWSNLRIAVSSSRYYFLIINMVTVFVFVVPVALNEDINLIKILNHFSHLSVTSVLLLLA
jgi:hypothetical protein